MTESSRPSSRTAGALELAAGLAEIVGGAVLLLWENPTSLALGIVLGIVLIVEGTLSAVGGFRQRDSIGMAHGVRGVITVVVGVVLVAWPDKTPLVLAIVIGGYLIGFGFYRIMSSMVEPEPAGEIIQMLVGTVAVIGGFIIIANPPEGVRLLTVIVGVAALIDGVFRFKSGVKEVLAARASPDSAGSAAL